MKTTIRKRDDGAEEAPKGVASRRGDGEHGSAVDPAAEQTGFRQVGSRRAGRAASRRTLVPGLVAAALILIAGTVLGIQLARRPDPAEVELSISSYIEGMAASGKLVLVEAKKRVAIEKTTPGYLFGDTSIGRFLGIRSDATVSASAWADLSYVIDLAGTERWSVRYDRREGGVVRVAAPPISILTPAIHTDTIEIRTVDKSLFLDERLLEGKLLASLTSRFVEAAAASLSSPELRAEARTALEALVRGSVDKAGVPAARIDVAFADAED